MSLTGATAVVMISVPPVFPVPLQIQGFAADNVFETDAIDSAEVLMGVDGRMSAGFVFVPVPQNFELQADSPSSAFFDAWWAAQQTIQDIYFAFGVISLKAVNKKWTLTRGALTSYKPIPDAKKLLQPQRFRITWQSVFPAPA